MKKNGSTQRELFGEIYLTGCTGWVGYSALETILKIYGDKITEKITCIGRRESLITQKNGNQKKVIKDPMISNRAVDLYIPSGFLTQEQYSIVGKNAYEETNHDIIKENVRFIRENQVKRVVVPSSGIVSMQKEKYSDSSASLAYRELKKYQEEVIIDAAVETNCEVQVLRIFSTSSSFQRNHKSYALANFIELAKKNLTIEISSTHQVFRKYCRLESLIELAIIRNLVKFDVLESAGELIEIADLARLVTERTGSNSQVVEKVNRSRDEGDFYFSTSGKMESLFSEYGIENLNLSQQIDLYLTKN